jgi:hypothetical protein
VDKVDSGIGWPMAYNCWLSVWTSAIFYIDRVKVASADKGTKYVHSPAGEGVGESQLRRLEKNLSTLSTLWIKVNLVENVGLHFSFDVVSH